MSNKREYERSGSWKELKEFTYYPDGRGPLEGGRVVDKVGREIDYLRYGEYEGDKGGIFYRTKRKAFNFFFNKLEVGAKVVFVPTTWSYFSASDERGKIVFVVGVERDQSSGDQLAFVSYHPSLGVLSFTEGWIRVKGSSIEGYYGGKKWRSQGLKRWERFGPIIININLLPLTISLAVVLEVRNLAVHNAGLLPTNPSWVIFTTRLPDQNSLEQIIYGGILGARVLAQKYTPQLRPVTPEEEEIFKSLLRSS